MNLIFKIILLASILACEGNPTNGAGNKGFDKAKGDVHAKLSDSIIFIRNTSSQSVVLGYLDRFYDYQSIRVMPYDSVTIKTRCNLYVSNPHVNYETTYLLCSGDSLNLSVDNFNYLKFSAVNAGTREISNILSSIDNIVKPGYTKSIIEYKLKNKKYSFNDLYSILDKRYQRFSAKLDSSSTKLSKKTLNTIKAVSVLDFQNKILTYIWLNKELQDEVDNQMLEFDSAYSIVQEKSNELLRFSPCHFKASTYSFFLRKIQFVLKQPVYRGATYNRPNSDSLYKYAKAEFLDTLKRDHILFLIVKEELLRYPSSNFVCIKEYENDIVNADFKGYLNDLRAALAESNQKEVDDVFYAPNKQKVNFSSVLDNLRGNVILIDNWASWCAPCREEIGYSKELISYFADKPFKLIYVSIENNINLWKKTMEDEKINTYPLNYLLQKFEGSAYSKRYKIETIPRYILMNKYGEIVDFNALRPSNPDLRKKIKELIIQN
jgi:thiol-disulfide isomerase/thioredoxin